MISSILENPSFTRFARRSQQLKIETTNICNADCTFCAYQFMERAKGIMPMDLFSRAVSEYVEIGGGALTVSSVVGDTLIDPHLLERVRLARSFPEIRMINTFTNLIALGKWSDAEITELLESIDMWSISIGPNRDVYKAIFQVDQFERVVSNLQRLVSLRQRAQKKARLRLLGRAVADPFIVDERLGEIHPALLDRGYWLTAYSDWGGVLPEQPGNTPVIRSTPNQHRGGVCAVALLTAVVFQDGTIGLCGCADYNSALTIGHLEKESLGSILGGRRRKIFLDSFNNGQLNRYCSQCTFYQQATPDRLSGWEEGTHPDLEVPNPPGAVLD